MNSSHRERQQLLNLQRNEESRFTPKKSTVDRILHSVSSTSVCLTKLLVAYVDLRKALDTVNEDVLLRILALRGIPSTLRELISDLYPGTECAVWCNGTCVKASLTTPQLTLGCVRDTFFPNTVQH